MEDKEQKNKYNDDIEYTKIIKEQIKNEKEEIIKTITYERTEKKLGSGGFGTCYLFKSENGEFFAGKIINKNKYEKSKNYLQKEIKFLQSIHRSDIVEAKSFIEDENYIYILLEYCENGSLQELINQRTKLNEREVQCIIIQLIFTLNYLHTNRIIHRDLKPENLLFDKNMHLKVADFGLSTQLEKKSKKIKGPCGTLLYTAPEILEDKEYSFEVDIWSLGIIIYYLLIKSHPFYGGNKKELLDSIKKGVTFPETPKISDVAQDLIRQILQIEPSKRPVLSQIIYHDFFERENSLKYLSDPSSQNEYPDEILNKKSSNIILNSIVRPSIPIVIYDNIENLEKFKKNNIIEKDISIYIIQYLDLNKKFGIGYLLNNGHIGIYYKDKTILVLNQINQKYIYIDKKNNSEIHNLSETSEQLVNKINILKSFIKYYEKEEKNKNFVNKIETNTIKEQNEENNFIYVKRVIIDNKCIIFEFSNETKHIFFSDKVQIIISNKDNILTYIDKTGNKINLSLENIINNNCIELIRRLKYIKIINFNSVLQKMNQNNKSQHHNHNQEKEKIDNE